MSEALLATPPSVDAGPSGSILVVDDEPNTRRFLADALRLDGHELHTAAGARRALVVLKSTAVDLVLTDVRMPGEDGVWLLRAVRSQYPTVPVLLMTGAADPRGALKCLRMGALDYLLKPLQMGEVRFAVRRALERRRLEIENARYRRDLETIVLDRTQELRQALVDREEAHVQLLEALVNALDAREQDTHHHSQRVASYSAAIARRQGMEEPDLTALYRGALLHDIGKIGIPDSILLKPSRLTEAEWGTMRRHPEIGARILNGVPHLTQAREILLSHHERWDGRGYPRGLQGERIPLGARIFAIADTFDVMTSGRPYRPPVPLEEVLREVHRCSGSQFDPTIASLFLQMVQGGELSPQQMRGEAATERALPPATAPVAAPKPTRVAPHDQV